MFNLRKNAEPTPLDVAIDRLHDELDKWTPETEEYATVADQLIKLMKLKEELSSKRRVSPDTLAVVGANLLGILAIIGHERVNVITTKAIGFVMKAR